MTRSLEEIWKGNLSLSVRYHPLGLPLFFICVVGVFTLFFPRSMKSMHWKRLNPIIPLMLLFAIFAVWVLRIVMMMNKSTFFLW